MRRVRSTMEKPLSNLKLIFRFCINKNLSHRNCPLFPIPRIASLESYKNIAGVIGRREYSFGRFHGSLSRALSLSLSPPPPHISIAIFPNSKQAFLFYIFSLDPGLPLVFFFFHIIFSVALRKFGCREPTLRFCVVVL
jgi:hypothetical protein